MRRLFTSNVCALANARHTVRGRARPPDRLQALAGSVVAALVTAGCMAHATTSTTSSEPPGRAASFPKPSANLLSAEPQPACTYAESPGRPLSGAATARAASALVPDAGTDASPQAAQIAASDAADAIARRERERDCFRDAETRVRAKLARLQSSVRQTLQALDRRERESAR